MAKKRLRMAHAENPCEDAGLYDLANGIVIFAIKEWHRVCRVRIYETLPDRRQRIADAAAELSELRVFFESDWCDILLCGNADLVIERLEREYDNSPLRKSIDRYAYRSMAFARIKEVAV